MVYKVKSIIATDEYRLLVKFDNGEEREFNMKPLIESDEMYKPLNDILLFKSVVVDCGGYGISWNDDIDMSEYQLYKEGVGM